MRAVWLIARYEFLRVVRQRPFLFFALGIPLFFVAISATPILIQLAQGKPTVGYVDQSGLLAGPVAAEEAQDEVRLVPFASEEAGRAALASDEIASLWVVPAAYLQTGSVRAIAKGEPDGREERAIRDLLRASLLRDTPPQVVERLQSPAAISYFALDTGRRVRQGAELIFALAVPLGLSLFFAISISFSSGFLAQAMAEEKENRLMEILVTSTRIWTLIAGKVLGLGAVALVQVLFWVSGVLLAAVIFFLRGEFPSGLPIPWELLGWAIVFFLLAFTLYATLLVGIGVIVGESREAQQVAGLLGLLAMLPIWFVAPLIQAPSGLLAKGLTFFPFTAPTLVPVRMALGQISLLEILISLLLLLGTIALAVWGVATVFRAAMLRYGTRLSINELFTVLARREGRKSDA